MKEVNGVKSSPAALDPGKAGSCNPLGLKDSRPENSDRNQSAK